MTEPPILRFPVSGQEHDSFLLEVCSNGSRPLDLKLVGSESTAVFLVKLRHSKIDEYKASPSHCSDEEWQQILISTFIDLKPTPDIEVRADVQSDGTSVTLTFRKNIQGITQRLGSITLNENSKTEVSPFDWCVSAIASRTKVADELVAATAKIESLEHAVNELKAQLDDFITTKEEDETQMLEKFRDLLNEKKLKIRQQQRLLADASAGRRKLTEGGASKDLNTSHSPGPSRSGKRKAQVKEEDESDDGFERMDIDGQESRNEAGAHSQSGSGSSADENQQLSTDNDVTASDPDPDTEDEPPRAAGINKKATSPPSRTVESKASTSKQMARSSRRTRAASQKQATAAAASESEEDDNEPPPLRTLPFTVTKKAPPAPQPVDDDETQSDDDSEL